MQERAHLCQPDDKDGNDLAFPHAQLVWTISSQCALPHFVSASLSLQLSVVCGAVCGVSDGELPAGRAMPAGCVPHHTESASDLHKQRSWSAENREISEVYAEMANHVRLYAAFIQVMRCEPR